ncbi:hypothetical protein [Pyxidicoccus caerfyrddinensis]|uniref:hypothetical protein n=1 Tax=Pyxidicoccus caerfyrddinensis TaxID=2709663 RepID=UPI001966D3D1|nr:hypothetical protein [Pyxidicoccus caerfyrddinensis]
MAMRPRNAVEAELAHVHFLLDELKRWDSSDVPRNVSRFLSERYERQARILLSVLTEMPLDAMGRAPVTSEAVVAPPEPVAAPVPVDAVARVEAAASAEAVAPVAQSVEPASTEPVAEPVEPVSTEPVAESVEGRTAEPAASTEAVGPVAEPAASAEPVASSPEPTQDNTREEPAREPKARAPGLPRPRRLPLPPNPAEAYAEPPQPRTATARLVEETSTWNRVWRPFLYESIMWFVGAFLILSGTLYFVFESWAGMSSSLRSLTVFGMTAGYSAGFSIWGAYLARREALRNPGHILGLIGSAAAPLAGIALGPLDMGEALHFGGVGPLLLIPMLLAWSGIAAVLVRKPAESLDAPSRSLVQAVLAASTLMMGLAPLAAKLGGAAPWLNLLPCALFFVLSSRPTPEPRKSAALVFAVAAPLYLLALYSVRLHVALVGVDLEPVPGSYAPFVAILLATALRFRTLEPERTADTLALGVVSLQVASLVAAATAPAPAFFVTAAVLTWTLVTLARGGLARLPWVYGAYASTYFAYASSAQLIPGPVKRFIDALKGRLGYPVTDALPLQYGALSALPFVTAGVVLAVMRLWRGERTGNARDLAFAEVLLRATAVASPLFAFYGMAGPDSRPAFWSALGMCLVCLTAGLLVERFYLTAVGAGLALLLPLHAAIVLGAPGASVVSGALALVLAGVSLLCTSRTRWLLASVVGVTASVGFLMGISGGGAVSVTGVVLCGAAAIVAAWAVQSAPAMAFAALLAAAALPKLAGQVSPDAVAPALAFVALGLALLGERGGLARLLGLPAVLYAVLALTWGVASEVQGLGLVVLTAAAAVAVTSRTFPVVRPLAVIIAALALLPDLRGVYEPWSGWMSPGLSASLFVLWSLGTSLSAVRWGKSASTTTAALVALLFSLVPVAAGSGQHVPLMLAAALAALLTARALPASLSVGVASLYAAVALADVGPVAMLALAAVLSILAVLEEVPAVLRIGAGGRRFALVATLAAVIVLGFSVVQWDEAGLPLLVAGTLVMPLLWTRANRMPFFAALMVPYTLVGIAVVGGTPPAWVQVLPLVALAVVRAAEHFPAVASLLLRSREEKPRRELSVWMQGALAVVTPLLLLTPWAGSGPVYFLTAALALMPGPRPFLRVCGAALFLLFVPEARPVVTGLLLALALASHHRPAALWSFFRCEPDAVLRPAAVFTALAFAVLPVLGQPTPLHLVGLAAVLAAAAFLLSRRWLLTPAVWALALAPVGQVSTHALLEWRPEAGLPIVAVALGAALLSAACQSGRVQRALAAAFARVLPELEGTWSEPVWVGGAGSLGLLLVGRLLDTGPGALALPVALGAGLTSCVLMVARTRWMANVATGLLGLSLIAAVPPLWAPAVVSGAGLALCLLGMWLDGRGLRVGAALHHGGWVLSLLSLAGLRDLEHVGTPLCIFFGLGAAWAVVLRRREREVVGWLASLAAVHGWLMHLGAVYSPGRGSEFILPCLPYFGAASALLATLAMRVAGKPWRRGVGHGFTVVALIEVLLGLGQPTPLHLAVLAAVLAAAAFLLSRRWLLTPAVWALALAPVGQVSTHAFLEWRPEAGLPIVAVALGAALLSAVCQSGRVQRALAAAFARVLPELEGTWSEPLWVGGAGSLGLLLVGRLLVTGPGALALPVALGAGLTSCVLMVARTRWMANVATGLLGLSLIAAVPPLWAPAVVSGAGLALCLLGTWLDGRGLRVGAALHHGGWVLSLLSLAGLRDLEHMGTPLCILFGLGAAWAVVLRRREREVVGWLASLAAVHGWLMHLGAVHSSGRGSDFILPYFGAASALLATLALFVAGKPWRRGVGHGFTVVALTEVLLGLSLLGATGDGLREALVASVSLAVLLFALVRRAAVEEDETSAYLAQGVLALGYLSVRLLGMGVKPGPADSLAALVGGALFTGLYYFVQREGSGLKAFRRPALVGAFLFPLAGLLSAPWGEPLQVAALLVGHAAHFAALGTHPSRRGPASLASVMAFNAALLLVWQGTGTGEPQYYVIPAGLSLLALLRVFRASIEEDTYARLRAVAVTGIYVAGAWKPLMFSDGGSMLLCVVLCVAGVGFGIALRIRSYVYLGTAFLVTCIAANLVRFGMRDHRIAAASLFMLGLLVIGSMVMLSAHRATLLQRYARVRDMLSTWEG